MRLTSEEHRANAEDWISLSSPKLIPGERVDREQLAEQLSYTEADEEDIEAIAAFIEQLSSGRHE